MYQWTEDMNTLCDGDGQKSMNYILVLLLGTVTFGIYGIIWLIQQSNRPKNNAARYNVEIKTGAKEVLLWSIFGSLIIVGPFIALNILIENQNKLAVAYNNKLSA